MTMNFCHHQEDDVEIPYDLIVGLVELIHLGKAANKDAKGADQKSNKGLGAVLIFLPGWDDISKVIYLFCACFW